jgi:hypothetical protein
VPGEAAPEPPGTGIGPGIGIGGSTGTGGASHSSSDSRAPGTLVAAMLMSRVSTGGSGRLSRGFHPSSGTITTFCTRIANSNLTWIAWQA